MNTRIQKLIVCLSIAVLFPIFAQAQIDSFSLQISNPELCVGDCAEVFVVDSNGEIPTNLQGQYIWQVSNGQTFSSLDPVFVFCPPDIGVYFIEVFIQTDQGTFYAGPAEVYVFAFAPVIVSSAFNSCGPNNPPGACEKVCAGTWVTYSVDSLSGGTTNATWTVIGAQNYIVDGNSVEVLWGEAGLGQVTVFVASFCFGSNSLCVQILENPTADFSSLPAVGPSGNVEICQGQTVYFSNLSTAASSYEWQFDQLGVSSEMNPEFTFLSPGSYEVQLIAYNDCFCADTTTAMIEVLAAEAPQIDCVGPACAGDVVTYTANVGCGSYLWEVSPNGEIVEGGTVADDYVSVLWSDGPNSYIQLEVAGCSGNICTSPLIEPIPVISDNKPINGRQQVCLNATETYSILEMAGSEYSWSTSNQGQIVGGQGTNEIVVVWSGPLSGGPDQWVQVDYANCYLECSGSSILPVAILNEYYLSGPIEVCQNQTATYQGNNVATGPADGWNWEVQAIDGTPQWSGPAGLTVAVDWTFVPGKYILVGTPVNPSQYCQEEARIIVDVRPLPAPPDAITGPTDICPGELYTFEATASSANPQFVWEVNDGGAISTLNGSKVVVSFGNTPPYEISVAQVATTGLACTSASIGMSLQSLPPPTMNGPAVVCVENREFYSATSFAEVEYEWTITPADAGTVVDGQGTETAEILWHAVGQATVEVTVCSQTASQSVEVAPLPDPQVMAPAGLCPGDLAAVSTVAGYAAYEWRDESGSVVSTASSPMLSPGHYEVEVTDANGCQGNTTFFIESYEQPPLTLSTPDDTGYCPPVETPPTLHATESDDGYTYQWYYNGLPTGGNTSTLFAGNDGFYYVEIVDANGCTAVSNTIEVFQNCSIPGVCNGSTVGLPQDCEPGTSVTMLVIFSNNCNLGNFLNTSPDVTPGTLSWDFGDGTTSNSQGPNVQHEYEEAGYYTVILSGISQSTGLFCYEAEIIDILLAANFLMEPTCVGDAAQFRDLTTFLPEATITGWEWDFGDPASGADNTSFDQDPTHVFSSPGFYNVTLTVTEQNGCTSVKTKIVEILPLPVIDFPQPPFNCENAALPFDLQSSDHIVDVAWDFGDAASGAANSATQPSTVHAFSTDGIFSVSLTATDVYGCQQTVSKNVAVTPNPLSGAIQTPQGLTACEGDAVDLIAPPGGTAWNWSNGGTSETISVDEEEVYSVTVTDDNGCTYTPDAVFLDVIPLPNAVISAVEYNDYNQPVGIFYNTYIICEGEDVNLQVPQNGQYQYQWSSGDLGTTAIFAEWRDNPLPVGTHVFTVTITDQSTGCVNTTEPFTVQVNELPPDFTISASGGALCENNLLTLEVDNPQASLTYVWNTGEVGTSIQTSRAGVYYAVAINTSGCRTESNELEVQSAPDIGAIPSGCHTRCNPDTICLPNLPNVVSYQWYQDGQPISAPAGTTDELAITVSGEYYVELTNAQGCTSVSDPLYLELYDAFGSILGEVYMDVNDNNIIDGPDTLVSGVTVLLEQFNTTIDASISNLFGNFAFPNIAADNYTVSIDPTSLSPDWVVVLTGLAASLQDCDDIEQVALLVDEGCPPVLVTENLSACAGETVLYEGQQLAAGSQQTFMYQAFSGCDSIVTVNVAELPTYTETLNLAACAGETVLYDGQQLAAGSQQTFMYQTFGGCDSTVTVMVAELPTYVETVNLSACAGETVLYDGQQLAAGSQQTFMYQTFGGCDSTVTVMVAELPTYAETVNLSACAGETVLYDGQQLAAGSQQTRTYQTFEGCDSTITVVVAELPTYSQAVSLSACDGETVFYNGQPLAAGSQQTFAFQTFEGCDSTVTVSVQALFSSETDVLLELCPGETANYFGTQIEAGETQVFVFTDQNGCDSTVTVTAAAFPEATFELAGNEVCRDAFDGLIEATNLSGGTPPFAYSIDDGPYQSEPIFGDLDGGLHTVVLLDANGCEFEEQITLAYIPEVEVAVDVPLLPCNGNSVMAVAQLLSGNLSDVTFRWPDGSEGMFWQVGEPGSYLLETTSECGTIATTFSVGREVDGRTSFIYLPNAFSPNFDGENDYFRGFAAEDVQIVSYDLMVFDRWGNSLFETHDISEGWDGIYRNERMNTGVYVFYVKALVATCGELVDVFKKGDVMLVR